MKIKRSAVLIPLASALVFSLLYVFAPFRAMEWRLYDISLGLKPQRAVTDSLVLLDVDDRAVAQVGVWPWPRSYMADALLRLKEFGAKALVFDIEYVDASPSGFDVDYFQRGLSRDFQRSFGDIASNANDLLAAILAGQLGREDAVLYSGELSALIASERDSLLARTRSLSRDNDAYLGKAMALYGAAWATLNLQTQPLEGAQAQRKALWKSRAIPLREAPGARSGGAVDLLAPIPPVIEGAKGAGFTNVVIDDDGVRRRIQLVQKVDGSWFGQLIFAPLLDALGDPEVELARGVLRLRGAQFPDGFSGDVDIPLDASGSMLIDWPRGDYWESYEPHLSFYALSYLEELEGRIDDALLALAASEAWVLFPGLGEAYVGLQEAQGLMDEAAAQRQAALDAADDAAFAAYLTARSGVLDAARTFLASGAAGRLADAASGSGPDLAAEAARVGGNAASLELLLKSYGETQGLVADAVRDKICVVGWVGTGTTDIGVNPFHGEYINVGTHAAVADTILSRSFLRAGSPVYSALLSLLLTPLVLIGIRRFNPGLRSAIGFLAAFAILALSFALFAGAGIFIGPLGPVLAMAAAVAVREALDFVGAERDKRFLRKAFGTYLSGEVVEQIIQDPSSLKLGGSKREMTALFTDVRGFSTISEQLDPEALVALLNRYLSGMSDIVLDEKGTIDKYEGDAIISFFGAPLTMSDHALRACRSAILMRRKEAFLNDEFLSQGLAPTALATRFGINSGDMVVGNMGTERKMNYTIMGNAVNLAARLEGVNKQYGSWILASDATVGATGDALLTRRMDRVRVVGIHEPVRLYEVINIAADATPLERQTVELFHAGLDAFEAKDWGEAAARFRVALQLASEDGPSIKYLERCEKFIAAPPAKSWDGVFNLTEK